MIVKQKQNRPEKQKEYLQRQIDLHKKLVSAYTKRFTVPSAQYYSKKSDEQLIKLFNNRNFNQILDLGCGTGFTINSLSDISKEVYGLDLSMDILNLLEGDSEPFGADNRFIRVSKR